MFNDQVSLIGYGLAAVAFALLTALMVTRWRQRVRGSLVIVAGFATVGWAVVLAWASQSLQFIPTNLLVFEMGLDFAWLLFLSSLLSGAVATESNWLVRRGGVYLGAILVCLALVLNISVLSSLFPRLEGNLLVMGSIATSLYALVGIEQIYRNARPSQQNGLKFLCLGLAAIFAFDLFLYTSAVVDAQIRPGLWAARGYVVVMGAPLIAISVNRVANWNRGIFASRQIVFYTTTLFAAGAYLTLVGFAGYYIQQLGTGWSDVLNPVFWGAALIGFVVLLMSDQVRARVRVWVAKHFFERKYDYREEWLRLIRTLTDAEEGLPLKKRAIRALAQILDSSSGVLWLRDSASGSLRTVAGWNMHEDPGKVSSDSALARFLGERVWIIDNAELQQEPDRYAPLTPGDLPEQADENGFIIPLQHDEDLLGFVSLSKPKTPFTLTFEDHDLLKTAGQQIASYLAQEMATEDLAESRQFEAFNRLTAFIMHDLKNAIAQQSMVVENADKHKRNPAFIDDAIETIKGSVERMRKVLGHLRQGAAEHAVETVDVARLIEHVETQCADRMPVPLVTLSAKPVAVRVNRERLTAALTHAVRNAQDACDTDGSVELTLTQDKNQCSIEISDNGAGMTPEFIRHRLFRPFDSTKGAEGMGIGAYQIRETIRAAAGDIQVESTVGAGTTITILLPIAETGAPA